MNFTDLVESHPEVVRDRYALSFSKQRAPAEIADSFSRFGVVMLKNALAPELLETCAGVFRRFVQSFRTGTGHSSPANAGACKGWVAKQTAGAGTVPGRCGTGIIFPPQPSCRRSSGPGYGMLSRKFAARRTSSFCSSGAPLGAASTSRSASARTRMQKSWPLPFLSQFGFRCRKSCRAMNSGLGFVVPGPDRLLPTLPHDDVGPEYVLSDLARLWIPPYAVGDLTIHSRFSPHFTTGTARYPIASASKSAPCRATPLRRTISIPRFMCRDEMAFRQSWK